MKILSRLRVVAGLSLFLGLFIFVTITQAQSPGPETESTTVSVRVGDGIMVFTGSTSPNALVMFQENNSIIGTASANGAGDFTQTFVAQSPGIHNVKIFAKDSTGHITDTIEQSISIAEYSTTTADVFLPSTIALSSVEVAQGETILINGETIPAGQVHIVVDGQTIALTTSSSLGRWGFLMNTGNLSPGGHQIYVVAQKSGGQQSFPTAARQFTVVSLQTEQNTPNAPPGTTAIPRSGGTPAAKPAAPVINSPKTGDIVDGNEITVRGTAPPNSQIELWNRGKPIGSAFANRNGFWAITIQLSEYAYELVARACIRGVCSDFSSPPVTFFRKTPPSNGFKIELDKYMLRGNTLKPVIAHVYIRGGTAPYTINVDWGDGKKDSFTISKTEFNVAHRYRHADHFNAIINGTDANGFTSHATFSADINAGPNTMWWNNVLLWPLLGLILLGAYIVWRRNKERYRRRAS
jgi:hypothetical protein